MPILRNLSPVAKNSIKNTPELFAAETKPEIDEMIEEAEEHTFNMSTVIEDRPSLVADLLDSKTQTILSKEQLERIKFCDMVTAQANNLKPGSRPLEASAKVQAML